MAAGKVSSYTDSYISHISLESGDTTETVNDTEFENQQFNSSLFFRRQNQIVHLRKNFERFENRLERLPDFPQVLHFSASLLPCFISQPTELKKCGL